MSARALPSSIAQRVGGTFRCPVVEAARRHATIGCFDVQIEVKGFSTAGWGKSLCLHWDEEIAHGSRRRAALAPLPATICDCRAPTQITNKIIRLIHDVTGVGSIRRWSGVYTRKPLFSTTLFTRYSLFLNVRGRRGQHVRHGMSTPCPADLLFPFVFLWRAPNSFP